MDTVLILPIQVTLFMQAPTPYVSTIFHDDQDLSSKHQHAQRQYMDGIESQP